MRRGLCAAAAAVVVALSVTPLFAAPASAQSNVTITPSGFALTPAPDQNGNVGTNALFVDGHFHVSGGFSPSFDWVAINLSWLGKAPGPPVPPPYTVCGKPPSGQQGSPCSGQDVDLAHHALVPPPTYNGRYRVSASAHATDQITGQGADGSTGNIDFNLVAPPPNVTGVTAAVDKNRVVTVSFDRDTSTPDLQSYYIYRKGPGDKDFVAIEQVLQLNSGARVNATDSTTQYSGGDYLYQVQSRRNGASGDGSTVVTSDRTKSQSNKVTVPDPPPGTSPPPTQPPASGGGPPPVVKGTPTGVSRSSGFTSSGSGSSSAATTPTSEAVTPDPGFARGLPYAAGSPSPDNAGGDEGDNSAVAVTPGRHKSNSRGIFVPVAAGAILFVGAFHLRILKKRLDEPVGTALS